MHQDSMNDLQKLRIDIQRYKEGKSFWLFLKVFRIEALWVIIPYRVGRYIRLHVKLPVIRHILVLLTWVWHKIACVITNIVIPFDTVIGPGLFIAHFGGIMIGSGVKIGSNATVYHGVTLGIKRLEDKAELAPTLGDNVIVSTGAKVLGAVKIGSNVIIGANAVVLNDIDDNCVAVGIPARIIRK